MNAPFELTFTVTFPEGLHVGAGFGFYSTIDAVQRKRAGEETPIVPATAVKGRLRYVLERLIATTGCCWMEHKDVSDCSCPVCVLFGNIHKQGSARFADLEPVEEKEVKLSQHTGVVLDRRRGTAKPDLLYTYEYVAPLVMRTSIKGRMALQNGIPDNLLCLALAVTNLDAFGGKKTVGKGRIGEVTIQSLKFNGEEWKDRWVKEASVKWAPSNATM